MESNYYLIKLWFQCVCNQYLLFTFLLILGHIMPIRCYFYTYIPLKRIFEVKLRWKAFYRRIFIYIKSLLSKNNQRYTYTYIHSFNIFNDCSLREKSLS
jgi:hypothetical protein